MFLFGNFLRPKEEDQVAQFGGREGGREGGSGQCLKANIIFSGYIPFLKKIPSSKWQDNFLYFKNVD